MTQCGGACLDTGFGGGGHALRLARDERVQCAPSLHTHVVSVWRPCGLHETCKAAQQGRSQCLFKSVKLDL